MIVVWILISLVVVLSIWLYLQLPVFGKAPSGKDLQRIKQSSNYKDGAFQNLNFTPTLTEGYSYPKVMWDFLFKKNPESTPSHTIPSVFTDLKSISREENCLVWFGHSSYYFQLDGKKFLVDPVFSGNASPISGSTKAFKDSDRFVVDDLPTIDYLLISHDHYDHLDYPTIRELQPKVGQVVCGLGVGSHFKRWGYPESIIIEKDWNQKVTLENNMHLHILPARHFSGRKFKRNNTLWISFLLESSSIKLFLGGDSGYDTHFKKIGDTYGPIDLAILENGQYNLAWHAIHCLPEETLKAAQDLQAKQLFPVHNSKFNLAPHSWKEPLVQISYFANKASMPLWTPKIGEKIQFDKTKQAFGSWWM